MGFRYLQNISRFSKNLIKLLLVRCGWKLVKISIKPQLIKENIKLDYVKSILDSNGILHVGGHRGSEAPIYYWLGKDVIWIEANPTIYEDLKVNIYNFPNQKAYNYLLSDKDNQKLKFNISSNDGASSSIFDFGHHHLKYGNREFKMVDEIILNSRTLKSTIDDEKIKIENFNFWVLDVQGAELLVLKGAAEQLKKCRYLYIEVSKKEFYKNGFLFEELNQWLEKNNFQIVFNEEDIHTNVLYKNTQY